MKPIVCLLFISLVAFNSSAAESPELLEIQQTWAKVNYQLEDDAQEKQFEALLVTIEKQITLHPEQAEFWVWQGIVQSSYAGAKGGLGALSLAKKARKSLQKALELDDEALQGSAYTSLGTLYHKVPGWPLGFGDSDEAKVLLEKALKLNPEGIDPNYFYGEYLYDSKDYKGAMIHLEKALNAPARIDRPLADASRRAEIERLIAQVKRMDRKN